MLSDIAQIYLSFLSHVPEQFRGYVSILLGLFIIYSIVQIIRQQFIWIIVLIVLLPTSVPILQGIANGVVSFIKFLFGGGN